MKTRILTTLITILACVLLWSPNFALAQGEQNASGDQFDATMEEMERADHSFLQAFDGWQQEYGGYRRSPILFEPLEDRGNNGKYPVNSHWGFGQMNLSVDDELNKSQLSVFQSIPSIAGGFADNAMARDDHLNLFRTVRGVAITTLSYLDKTVAAALATTQQQVDNNVTHMLLKQISWTNAQIANKEREELFREVDEKFEYCMVTDGGGPGGATNAPKYLKHVQFTCNNECSQFYSTTTPNGVPPIGINRTDKPQLYHYCVCCAEREKSINRSVYDLSDPAFSPVANGGYSLVDRVFYGSKMPTVQGSCLNCDEHMRYFGKYFRSIYGDYVTTVPTAAVGELGTPGTHQTNYAAPLYSVTEWIKMFRDRQGPITNGCISAPDYYSGLDIKYCPITMETLHYGICPAFKYILDKFDNNTIQNESVATLKGYWAEASLGGQLTAADFVNVKNMGPGVRRDRWIETFCDSSAATAFKKMHLRMMSISLDHISLNHKVLDKQREEVKLLMNRVSSQLELGALDSLTSVRNQLVGLAVESDRRKEAERSATWSAAIASQETSQQLGQLLTFGGSLDLVSQP